MPDLNRRRFLQLGAATAAFSAMSQSISRAASIPANRATGSLKDVEHIVVLMQENRSFDHYFGALRGVRGFGDPRPVTFPNGKPVWHQPDGAKEVLPFRPDADDLGLQFIQDLNHDWAGTHRAFNNGKYDQWIPAKSATTMAYLTREDIPFHYALADAFTVCDAYHCSLMGSTDPNRYYMWTGYVGNDGKGGGPVLGNEEKGYGWTTYPERLEQAGVSWKIYQDKGAGLDADGGWGWGDDAYIGNYGDNSLLYFNSYRNAQPGDPLYEKARTGTDVRNGDGLFDVLAADVKSGKLPQISWIAAPEAYSEHPNWPANYGAWYVSQVLDALTSDPEVWSRTALFLTYDENDGFFDHVVPPYPPSSAAQGLSTVDVGADLYTGGVAGYAPGAYGLGQRVPMLVLSPWSTGGYVCSETFDHTSILRFMEKRFGVREPNISPWRRAVCGDLTSAFDFSKAHAAPTALPSTDAYAPPDRDRHPDYVPEPPAQGSVPTPEAGTRPARPLRYASVVEGAPDTDAGRFVLTFSDAVGAAFLVTSAIRSDGPWTYTVEGGKKLSDSWATASDGSYDLTVHGPNGFLRTFRGKVTADLRVTAHENRATGGVELVLASHGRADCHLTVTDGYGDAEHRLTVRAGRSSRHAVAARRAHRWYDLTVRCEDDPGFLRRFAGHVETGATGTSDPGLTRG
ncbi:phosphocholine-specific phospholipase C [Streptomyces sp. NPDC059740]|uniref:phosphocholine-specific phospholipase C n=1 Tax=Streptomyces sp. NPDC059740 TaxID=3346926 RepID=UPI003653C75E